MVWSLVDGRRRSAGLIVSPPAATDQSIHPHSTNQLAYGASVVAIHEALGLDENLRPHHLLKVDPTGSSIVRSLVNLSSTTYALLADHITATQRITSEFYGKIEQITMDEKDKYHGHAGTYGNMTIFVAFIMFGQVAQGAAWTGSRRSCRRSRSTKSSIVHGNLTHFSTRASSNGTVPSSVVAQSERPVAELADIGRFYWGWSMYPSLCTEQHFSGRTHHIRSHVTTATLRESRAKCQLQA
jgi:hypothetical protein